jgi:cell wall-associated NlpC family hydrolase
MSRSSSAGVAAAAAFASGVLGLTLLAGALGAPPSSGSSELGSRLHPGAIPAAYFPSIEQAGAACPAIPAAIVAAQVQAESDWNPRAVSPAGAQGISQFMPGTWALWGRDGNGDGAVDVWDPADAIPSQAAYDCALATQMQTALDAGRVTGEDVTDLALAAYNAGPAAVLAAGGIPQNGQTPQYVTRIDSLAATFTDTGNLGSSTFGAAVVTAARQELGLPYVWGGGTTSGPSGSPAAGFDCSGLVLFAVYQASGGTIALPHSSGIQQTMGVDIADGPGSTINLAQLQPGDVIAFALGAPGVYDHIGIYLGDRILLHASHPGPGGGVKLESLTEAYFQTVPWSVRRYG